MAIDLTAEQRQLGQDNFGRAVEGLDRRRFLKGVGLAAGAAIPVAGATWFGYESLKGRPVKTALIGGGDEGGVLVGEHNPDYLEFIAVADIRPFNLDLRDGKNGGRIFEGDPKVALRKGFRKVYGNRANDIRAFRDYKEMLDKVKDIEAVVIATPLVTHATIAIDCLRRGKHVLCEKLMARTISECKEMIKVAKQQKRILSIGHQRHYSLLYAHAHDVVESGILGDIRHIRALWHRNFSWPWSAEVDAKGGPALAQNVPQPTLRDGWYQPIYQMDFDELKDKASSTFGYKNLEELIRWRLYDRSGGGLMAELGSHQLDACSIFLGHVHPLRVQGVGHRSFFDSLESGGTKNPRECDDSIFLTFEFPGRNHPQGAHKGKDKNDIVVVTYSSVSTNGFENYGECLMGSRGTMIVEKEEKVFLYTERDPRNKSAGDPKATAVGVTTTGGKPAIESGGTWGGPGAAPAAAGGAVAGAGAGPVSRGYREEMEDFAFCVREWKDKVGWETRSDGAFVQRVPRCHGKVAMADAIIAMTANLAMKKKQIIEFEPKWFEPDAKETPETA